MEAPTGILSVGIPGLPPLATIPLAGPHPLHHIAFTPVFLAMVPPQILVCEYIL